MYSLIAPPTDLTGTFRALRRYQIPSFSVARGRFSLETTATLGSSVVASSLSAPGRHGNGEVPFRRQRGRALIRGAGVAGANHTTHASSTTAFSLKNGGEDVGTVFFTIGFGFFSGCSRSGGRVCGGGGGRGEGGGGEVDSVNGNGEVFQGKVV